MCNCSEHETSVVSARMPVVSAGPTVTPLVPLSRQIAMTEEGTGDQPSSLAPQPAPGPIPPLVPCRLDFREGCYQITYKPTASLVTFEGTLRVDRSAPDGGADHLIVSGDLYTHPLIGPPFPVQPAPPAEADAESAPMPSMSVAGALSAVDHPPISLPVRKPLIPIFARARYHSYLKVTSVSAPLAAPSFAKCQLTIIAQQFNYTQPPAGQFRGTFPDTPSRTVTLKLSKVAAPFPFSQTGGPFYEGRLFEGGVDKGSVTLGWVSQFFRRASLEIDTLAGAVRPAPVPGAGATEFFDTVFAKTGWQLTVVQDQTNVPVPAGVVPTNCWSSPNLHALMASVRNPATNLDTDWHVHMIVVPAKLGCGRGVMYDTIDVPREGCASFSDDGYPTGDSANFGLAANKKQRDVPRAFLRSAIHEVTHTFNQIHQEQETTADNSIMTTTPSVADVLGGPTTGEPGVFPDQIKLAHNATVRHHLNHMPDPVIRPGGWPFASWFPTGAPQAADRHDFAASELALTVTAATGHVAYGQPLDLSWTMTNTSSVTLRVPKDVSTEALFTSITVTDSAGRERPVRPFVILCEHASIAELQPGKSVSASTKLFWSSEGFAFERPGRYRVDVAVAWSAQGVLVGVQSGLDIFVDYPTNDAENDAAGLVLNPEVGKWVALGGGAYHLAEASRRLFALSQTATPAAGAGARTLASAAADRAAGSRVLASFADLMPDARKLAQLHPELTSDAAARTAREVSRTAAPNRAKTRRGKGRPARKR